MSLSLEQSFQNVLAALKWETASVAKQKMNITLTQHKLLSASGAPCVNFAAINLCPHIQ